MRLLVTVLATGISVVMGIAISVAFGQDHSAHWYNKEAASGKFSVILNVPDGTEPIVAVAREKVLTLLLQELAWISPFSARF